MRDFITTYDIWFYYGWTFLFFVHIVLNDIIYTAINKEEFEDHGFWAGNRRSEAFFLAVFTFRWSRAYQEDESKRTRLLMKVSNILSIVLIAYTVIIVLMWGWMSGGA